MKKNVVKINENALKQIVAESVKKVLRENEEEFIGDELGTIKNAINSIKEKISRGNLAGGDDSTSTFFLSEKVDEMENIINELLSDNWY